MDSKKLSHFNKHVEAHMVDVGSKAVTNRKAIASGKIFMNKQAFETILAGKIKKGDVLSVARLAAIQGSKQTSFLIPLCHPIAISHIDIEFKNYPSSLSIELIVTCLAEGKTGVEMEAIMGVNAALITIYDLSKIINPHLKIDNVKLLIKEGGKNGLWKNPDGLPIFLKDLF